MVEHDLTPGGVVPDEDPVSPTIAVASASALLLALAWAVVMDTEHADEADAPAVSGAAALAEPVAGLVPAAPPRRVVVVRRRSRAS